MRKIIFLLAVFSFLLNSFVFAQVVSCRSGKVDTTIARLLKDIGTDNRSLEEIKKDSTYIEKMINEGPPVMPFPEADVLRTKVTADSIPVYIFNPSHGRDLPIIVNFHGGGFIQPFMPFMNAMMWNDAKALNAIVFAVDYRVAPQHRFPAALNDCYDAFKWVSENGAKYGGDTSRIVLMGMSAGANLVATVSQKAKKEGINGKIKLQVMNCPVTDNPVNSKVHDSRQQNEKGYLINKSEVLFALETYAANEGDYKNPLYAPLQAADVSGLPPAVLIVAEFDPLRDEGTAYANRLMKSGVKVWYKCFPGQIHCLIGSNEQTWNSFEQKIAAAMNEVLAKQNK